MTDQELRAAFERFIRDTDLQAELQAGLQRFKKDISYLAENRKELLEQYPEQWIAIYNEQVVGASTDYEQLLSEVETKGIPISHGVYEYLTHKPQTWIL